MSQHKNYGRHARKEKHKHPTLTQILQDDEKRVNEAKNLLSKLLRIIFADLRITIAQYSNYMNKFLLNPANLVPNNPKDRSTTRGNLTKEIARPVISFPVFVKALRLIRITRVTFNVVLESAEVDHHGRPKVSNHTVSFTTGLREESELPAEEISEE